MQSLSKSDEQLLLDGVKQAVDLVDHQGFSPNDAVQKVAEDLNYSPGFVKAACNAFNTGRQLAQWNANDSVLDKLASFPLADYDTIHANIWGNSQEKAASVSPQLGQPRFESYEDQARHALLTMSIGSVEKSAEAEEPSPLVADYRGEVRVKAAFDALEWQRRNVEECRRQKSAADDQLNLKLHLLEGYFKKFAYDRLPLAQVEDAVTTYCGKPGAALMGYVASKFPSEKRAADHQPTWAGFNQPSDRTAEPYTLVEACIKQAEQVNQQEQQLAQAITKLAEAEGHIASFTRPQPESTKLSQSILTPSLIEESGEKQASVLAGMMGGAGMGFSSTLAKEISQDEDQSIQSKIEELDDPSHLDEMRKIRAQTVLTELMTDPTNPLSEHDPEEVLKVYNEMVQLSPRLADQPGALGPMLNKRIMGNVEPFEVGEQLKIEESLNKTQSNPVQQKSVSDLMKNEASIIS